MKVIVYFGHHKVGSTALQAFFSRNYLPLLQQGILYPGVDSEALSAAIARVGGQGIARASPSLNVREPHNALAFQMMYRGHPERVPHWHPHLPGVPQMIHALRAQVRFLAPHTVVLCSEVMSNFGTTNPDLIDDIRRIFPKAEYEFYCALRRPDQYLASWHGQRLKFGHKLMSLSQGAALDYAPTIHFDYHAMLDPWIRKIGQETLHIRNYADVRAAGGSVEDLLEQTGLEVPADLQEIRHANKSLPRAAMEIVRRGNYELSGDDQRLLKEFFLNTPLATVANAEIEMFGAPVRKELFRRFEPIHHYLNEQTGANAFFPDIDEMTRLRPVPEDDAVRQLLTTLEPDSLPNDTLRRFVQGLRQGSAAPAPPTPPAVEGANATAADTGQTALPKPPETASETTAMMTLQNITFPDVRICTEHELFFRPEGEFGMSQTGRKIWLDQGSLVRLNTYFNLFNLTRWCAACDLDGLFLEIGGTGRVEIRVFQAIPDMSWEILYCEIATLGLGDPHLADLSHFTNRAPKGLIYVEIKALSHEGATLVGGRFATNSRPETLPRLAISITTFKREEQIRDTVARLEEFLKTFEFGDQVHVQVVDNGHSANIPASTYVTPILNPNYGGAGGFARGLLEAEKAGFTHCLFMDDDAIFHMENIARAYAFLTLAKDPDTAVAGAMINNAHKWAMWENGAVFDGGCHPLFCGTDLRIREALFAMEFESTRPRPAHFYGGWWFFAFAIDRVKHYPFPFFVRGDDVSFSLMNDFNIHTLNGVVSFQDEFSEKENPQVHYLNLRSHLIHHMVTPGLARSGPEVAEIATRFIKDSLLRFHYESAEAQLLAWQDVMEGPEFFDRNIDMAERRETIKALTVLEDWQPVQDLDLTENRRLTRSPRAVRKWLGTWTCNGHLIPFSGRSWDRIVLGTGDRPFSFPTFGASHVTYLNTTRDMGYQVIQSKPHYFSLLRRMRRLRTRFLNEYDALGASYRARYDDMASKPYWEQKLET